LAFAASSRFERPRGERGGEQDANLWRLRLYGLHPVLARRRADRERPGQVEEVTSAAVGVVSSYESEPRYRTLDRANSTSSRLLGFCGVGRLHERSGRPLATIEGECNGDVPVRIWLTVSHRWRPKCARAGFCARVRNSNREMHVFRQLERKFNVLADRSGLKGSILNFPPASYLSSSNCRGR
jgi:hypothetical protein